MSDDVQKTTQHIVADYLENNGFEKIATQFKNSVGITYSANLPKLQEIVIHYNKTISPKKKLKLSPLSPQKTNAKSKKKSNCVSSSDGSSSDDEDLKKSVVKKVCCYFLTFILVLFVF